LQVLDAAWQQSLAGCIRLSGPGGLKVYILCQELVFDQF